jgi:carbon-monoxide dehydrogenase large subunit
MSTPSEALVGQAIPRVEDDRLLRGNGRYVGDLDVPGAHEIAFVRSPFAHASIVSIDMAEARALPGVLAVYSAADLDGAVGRLPMKNPIAPAVLAGMDVIDREHPLALLAEERVVFVGQAVAMVVAIDRYVAEDAAGLVDVTYDPLTVVVDPLVALEPDAPLLEPSWGTNIAVDIAGVVGDVEAAFSQAAVVISEEFRSHRYVAAPLEGRGIMAAVDPQTGDLSVWASTQTPHRLRLVLAGVLGMPAEQIRVRACDVGGGFGQKSIRYVEEGLVAFAATHLRRPVRWTEDRSENLTSASHGREQVHRIELAADADGRLLAVRDDVVINLGAFNVCGTVVPHNTISHLVGPYDIPEVSIRVRGVLTNTCFTSPYRGAGRPEAVFAMERAIDRLAAALEMEPAELRARNLLRPDQLPHDTGLMYRDGHAQVYDSGDFPELFARARARADVDAVRARQRELAGTGRRVGVGFSMYVEGTGVGPFEGGVVEILPSGRVRVATGAASQGQGHQTVFGQIVADALGVPLEAIDVVGGDSAALPFGFGTIASRSVVVAGNAIHRAAVDVRQRVLTAAGDMLEASVDDLDVVDGRVVPRGAPSKAVSFGEIAAQVSASALLEGAPGDGLLRETAYFRPPTVTWSSAAHAAIVEIDEATGTVRVDRYIVVHDCGRVVNPLLADGQVVGGVAQGIGGILFEELVYDEQGQPVTASFMDYRLPTVAEIPKLELEHIETWSTLNPLGVKGLGEGGAIGPPAAIANAVEDALADLGVVVRQGPLTPPRVRSLIRAARR